MNLHPLHRRRGTLVLKSEVEEALRDFGLEAGPFSEGRLIDAYEVERLLVDAGISVELVKHRTAAFLLLALVPLVKRRFPELFESES